MSKNEQNEPKKFYCKKCNYFTDKKNNFDRHVLTQKHIRNDLATDGNKNEQNEPKLFLCTNCNREFLSKSGLWRHRNNNKCIIIENGNINLEDNSSNSLTISDDLIMQILNDNKEMRSIIFKQQEQISELIPKVGNNNTTNNTQNNKFNINVFLNTQCKDAINMSDFIKSLHVTLEQLDFTKQNGLADGISKSIIENMNKLSIYQRPLHCTDVKRETLYIKEENSWTKDKAKEKIKNAIKKTSSKNYNALLEWKNQNPDYMSNEDKTDYFTKTISTIGKSTDSIDEKVIKNLCKETYIKNAI